MTKMTNLFGVKNVGKVGVMKDENDHGRGIMTDYRAKFLTLQSRLDQCESLLRDGVALMDATKEIVIMMANAIALHHKEHPESKVTLTDRRLWKIVQEMEDKGWLKKQ